MMVGRVVEGSGASLLPSTTTPTNAQESCNYSDGWVVEGAKLPTPNQSSLIHLSYMIYCFRLLYPYHIIPFRTLPYL